MSLKVRMREARPTWLRLVAGAVALVGPVLFGACASHSIDASDFDQACTEASDCVPVFAGTIGCCYDNTCDANAAINKSAFDAYKAEQQAKQECSEDIPCLAGDCLPVVVCASGKCALKSP